jgi:hypothetical protein
MRTSLRHRRAFAALIVLPLLSTIPLAGRVAAAPPSSDPAIGAQAAAHWLAAQVNAQGFVPGPTNDPNFGATLQTAVSLADVHTEEATFDLMVAWLAANTDAAITNGSANDSAGNLGWLLMIVEAAGDDPANFGGIDLVARLDATLGLFAPGLYGVDDPTYDGAFRQGLALLGLAAHGITPPAAATSWLAGQQCDATTPSAEGGWQPYRSDINVPCDAPDPNTFVGPDTNSSAMALQALQAVGPFAGADEALDFLAAAQGADGGFPFVPGGEVDPNSTALVIQAIVAGGEDPVSGRWVNGTATPITSLLSWQLGCSAPAADIGAMSSPFSGGSADPVATVQGVWGLQGDPFPVAGPVTFVAAQDPCAPATTTTTAVTTSTVAVVAPAAATPVSAAPAFTG